MCPMPKEGPPKTVYHAIYSLLLWCRGDKVNQKGQRTVKRVAAQAVSTLSVCVKSYLNQARHPECIQVMDHRGRSQA